MSCFKLVFVLFFLFLFCWTYFALSPFLSPNCSLSRAHVGAQSWAEKLLQQTSQAGPLPWPNSMHEPTRVSTGHWPKRAHWSPVLDPAASRNHPSVGHLRFVQTRHSFSPGLMHIAPMPIHVACYDPRPSLACVKPSRTSSHLTANKPCFTQLS